MALFFRIIFMSLLLICSSSQVFAAQKPNFPTMTLFGGSYFSGKSADVDGGLLYGLKLGCEVGGNDFSERLGIETLFTHLNSDSAVGTGDGQMTQIRLDVLYLLDSLKVVKKLQPFFSVGAGVIYTETSVASDSNPVVAYGGGLRYHITDYLALRTDVRHVLVFEDDQRNDFEYTLGFTYTFGKPRKSVPKAKEDTDLDGVSDSLDQCPDTPQGLTVDRTGCPVNQPDQDQDGISDYLDRCSDTPSGYKVDDRGCPRDDDNDGVPNERDKCPSNPPGYKVDEYGCMDMKS